MNTRLPDTNASHKNEIRICTVTVVYISYITAHGPEARLSSRLLRRREVRRATVGQRGTADVACAKS